MLKSFIKIFIILLLISNASCAKRGTITGGKKDTLSPVLKFSLPENGTVNFNGKEIKLYFNEYVKLKNVGKQLIISPPMKNTPDILPYNVSKFITIKLKDTLIPNTTYSFNFGQSIEDNNEGNILPQFKYVFSTGSYIDSLALKSTFKDAIDKKDPNFISIMLYELNEKYNDSTVYKEVPKYIANSLDSLKLIKLENLKQGKYKLIALKDKNNNNKFDPKLDKIGFIKDFITIPNDTVFQLNLFKEELPFKVNIPSPASRNRATMGYEGNPNGIEFNLKKANEVIPFKITKLPEKDSLQIWFKPIKNDSIAVFISKDKYKRDFILTLKDKKMDTLNFTPKYSNDLPLREKYSVKSSIPLTKIDKSKIKLLYGKDNIASFTTFYDEFNQNLEFEFEKLPEEKYKLMILPEALIDFYDRKNDSIQFNFSTRNTTDYGNLRVKLENVKRFPIIVELTDDNGKVLATQYSKRDTTIDFNLLEPNKFTLRLIYDDNNNRVWTPGNYLEKKQSEEVIYFPKEIDVRANWDVEQPFDVGK